MGTLENNESVGTGIKILICSRRKEGEGKKKLSSVLLCLSVDHKVDNFETLLLLHRKKREF